MFLVINS